MPRASAETAQLAQAAAPQIVGSPLLITTRVLDVADRAAMFEWPLETAAQHQHVNLVFNNAGVALSSTIEGMEYADLEWIVGVNFWGVVHGTKAFLPYIKASGAGHIVNTSSVFGLFSQPGMSGYNATKFAVRGFTEALRQELDLMKCGVSATCVHPGGIRTGHRAVQPDLVQHGRLHAGKRTARQGRLREVLHHHRRRSRTRDSRRRAQEQAAGADRTRCTRRRLAGATLPAASSGAGRDAGTAHEAHCGKARTPRRADGRPAAYDARAWRAMQFTRSAQINGIKDSQGERP